MRHFVRQAAYGGRVCAVNQYYKSNICDDILNIISKELNVEGNTYEKIEAYVNYKNEHIKRFEKEYESQFDDHRDENEEEKENFINEELSQLPIHQLLKQLSLNDYYGVMMLIVYIRRQCAILSQFIQK